MTHRTAAITAPAVPMRACSLVLAAAMLGLVGGCQGNPSPAAPGSVSSAALDPTNAPPPIDPATVDTTIVIRPVGNELAFAQEEVEVRAGQRVLLVMDNVATALSMSHNVVVVTGEDAVDIVGQAALAAAITDYVPESEATRILAATPMASPGERTETVFTAPDQPGEHPYICTFPGHYVRMRGTLTVVP